MSWKPLQARHAIERVKVVVRYPDMIPTKYVQKLGADLKASMNSNGLLGPRPRQAQSVQVNAQTGTVVSQSIEGWEFVRTSPDGSVIEAVSCEANNIVYETAEYVDWKGLSARLSSILLSATDRVDAVLNIQTLFLEYTDRFIFEGEPSQANAAKLLNTTRVPLPDSATTGGELWHVHLGWFQKDKAGRRILVNQNFDAQDGEMPAVGTRRSIQVTTNAEMRAEDRAISHEQMLEVLDFSHQVTNSRLEYVLNASMVKMIGLKK